MRSFGDRRSRIRFEAFGQFWGTFDAGDSVRVHDLTRYGALVESSQPFAVESIQRICLVIDDQPVFAAARIRHSRPIVDARGPRYLIGMEFLTESITFTDAVERLIARRERSSEPA